MLFLAFASFLAFGVVLVLLGANQADLARDLGLDLTRTGLLASALSAGLGVGVVIAGPLVDRRPRRPIYLAAMGLTAVAAFGFDAGMGFARAVACCTLLGLGIGIYDTLISALVVERYREHAARPMALVHSAATLGAVLGPLLVGWTAAHPGWAASFHWTGAAHLALAGGALLLRFPAPSRAPGLRAPLRSVLAGAIVPFAAISFAYVGLEASLTIFAVPYASGGLELDALRGLDAISALWLGLFVGRLALLAIRSRPDARLLLGAGLAGAATLAAGAALGLRAVELHFAATGMALGLVFPLMIALAGQRFPDARATAVGLVTGAGAVGGFAVPWLHGAIGDAAGVAVAVGGLAVWALAIAVAALFAPRRR